MCKLSILPITLLALYVAHAETVKDDFIKVAVIDTGINPKIFKQGRDKGICKMDHKDLTGTGLKDNHGHGTNISGLIHKYAQGTKYCQIIIKFYDPHTSRLDATNLNNMVKAIRYAISLNVNFINISGGGTDPNEEERVEIVKALDKGITVVVAAGNEHCNLDVSGCTYYPAGYDKRIVVAGNGKTSVDRSPSSNWGSMIDIWFDGSYVAGEYGRPMTGTSQAAAIQTGKLVRDYVQKR